MTARHITKYTDLFLVRFWAQDQDTNDLPDGRGAWRGKVQRTVDGEVHEFGDWDALVTTLRAMLAATSPELVTDVSDQKEFARSESPDIDEE